MGKRLTKIYTRKGDKGETRLGDGSKVAKEGLRIESLGTVDELNCLIGKLLSHPMSDDLSTTLTAIQHHLFDLGGELCLPGQQRFPSDRTTWLESHLDRLNSQLPALQEFILPGGSGAAAECHLARAVCRRAERTLCALNHQEPLNEAIMSYLNRLSDLLFVMARSLNKEAGYEDILWQHNL